MITQLDTTKLDARHKNLPFRLDLESFIDEVALSKPKAKFAIDNDCVSSDYVMNETKNQYDHINIIYRVKVYEGGEQIGSIATFEEYRNGRKVPTYAVESFRIEKERGRSNTTTSMHRKVAIRNAKKFMVARNNDELANQIGNLVKDRVRQLTGNLANGVVWATSQSNIAMAYALAAYRARLEGSGTITLPANDANLIKNTKHCDDTVAKFYEAETLNSAIENKRGYAIQAYTDNSYAVVEYATGIVTKYQHFEDIPQNISEKLAMFKVIDANEPYSHLGMKVQGVDAFYIVDGETKTEQ